MLDGGPSRIPQPIDQREAGRSRLVHRQPAVSSRAPEPEPAPLADVAPSAPRSRREKPNKSKRSWVIWLVAVIVVALAAVAGFMVWQNSFNSKIQASIDDSKYQAVFFDNGQVYFGKLSILDKEYFLLDDVFYVQSNATTGEDPDQEPEDSTENTQKLIKRGAEVHGPADPMVVSRDKVMFFENLKTDGKVTQLIRGYKSGKR